MRRKLKAANEHQSASAPDADRLEKVRQAVREVDEPDHRPLTLEDVEALREDPDLAEVAEIAEEYV